ncbi:MAG: hypothetical protein AAGF15_05360 [Pseudomonadota bacterium]
MKFWIICAALALAVLPGCKPVDALEGEGVASRSTSARNAPPETGRSAPTAPVPQPAPAPTPPENGNPNRRAPQPAEPAPAEPSSDAPSEPGPTNPNRRAPQPEDPEPVEPEDPAPTEPEDPDPTEPEDPEPAEPQGPVEVADIEGANWQPLDPFTYCFEGDCITTDLEEWRDGDYVFHRWTRNDHAMITVVRTRETLVSDARPVETLSVSINGALVEVDLFDFQQAMIWQSGILQPYFDVEDVQNANLLPRYETPLNWRLNDSSCWSYDLDMAGLPVRGMGQGGLRPDIGYLEGRFAAFLASGHPCAYEQALTYAFDLARATPWAISEFGESLPLDFDGDWRRHSIDDSRQTNGNIEVFAGGPSAFVRAGGIVAETNHMPQPYFGPFMLTGHPFFLMQMGYQASFATGKQPGRFQGEGDYALIERYQERGGPSWTMRTLGMLVLATPDDAPAWLVDQQTWRARFIYNRDEFMNIIRVRDAERIIPIVRQPSRPIETRDFGTGRRRALMQTPWMIGYGQLSMGFLSAAGLQEAEVYRSALVQPLVDQFETEAFPNGLTAMFRLPVGDANGVGYTTMVEVADAAMDYADATYPGWSSSPDDLPFYGPYQQELHMIIAAQVKAGDDRFAYWLEWIEDQRDDLQDNRGRIEYFGR